MSLAQQWYLWLKAFVLTHISNLIHRHHKIRVPIHAEVSIHKREYTLSELTDIEVNLLHRLGQIQQMRKRLEKDK